MSHWNFHPTVRSGSDLSAGERAADRLKATFGSWTFLGTLNAFIFVWILANLIFFHFDPYPFILLNLGLSWLAAQQGGALQIAANRGDRIASEQARHTVENSERLIEMNERQLAMLEEIRQLRAQIQDGAQ
jgi:uncharacterized membrane protein